MYIVYHINLCAVDGHVLYYYNVVSGKMKMKINITHESRSHAYRRQCCRSRHGKPLLLIITSDAVVYIKINAM